MSGRLFPLVIAAVLLVGIVGGCTTTVSETMDYDVTDGSSASVVDAELEHLRQESLKYPRRSDIHYQMALLSFQRADYHESREALEKAIELEPDVSEYQYHLGRVLLRMQELEVAEERFREAVRLQPKNRYSGPHAALGWTLTLRKNWDGALAEFQKCVEIEPGNPIFYYFLGSIHDLKGEKEKAIQNFQEYLARGGKTFRKKAAYILEKMGVEVDSIPTGRTGNEEVLFGPMRRS